MCESWDFNFKIYENRYESRKCIGSLSILKIDYEEFGLFESLDCHPDAVALLDLFQNIKNATLKTKYRKKLEYFDWSSSIYMIDKVVIKSEYRGNKILRRILIKAFELMNVWDIDFLTIASPLYDTDTNKRDKKYFEDRKRLVKYYESIGFEKLTDGKNVIMYLKYAGEVEWETLIQDWKPN